MAAFLNALDGRALLWMYAQMEDRPLSNLTALQTDQVRSVLALRTEIDVVAWREKTTAFLAGEANEVDWGPFAGLTASNGAAPRSRADAPGTPRQAEPISVNGVPATPGSQGGSPTGDATERLIALLGRIETKLDKLDGPAGGSEMPNALGRKRSRAKEMLDELGHDQEGEAGDDEVGGDTKEGGGDTKTKKAKLDILESVRKYYDGSTPLTDRQALIRLELSKLPLNSIAAFFGALRRVASTIDAGEGEYRKFNETMTHTEAMVLELFTEAMGQQHSLSAKHRDALEAKFVTLLKAKMLSSEKFNFVKAAADAQQVIMKDLKETRNDDHRREDRRRDDPRAKGGITCFECGRKGHKSFECKADEDTRKKYKESRAKP